MGKMSRNKGARNERGVVNELRAAGIAAVKVPLSGAAGGRFGGDVLVEDRLRFEAKVRRDGFRELYRWINENYRVFIRADRQQTLIVIRLPDFAELLKPGGGDA